MGAVCSAGEQAGPDAGVGIMPYGATLHPGPQPSLLINSLGWLGREVCRMLQRV